MVEQDVSALLAQRVRDVAVTFADETEAGFLAGVPGVSAVEQRNSHALRATVKGDELNPLLARLAQRDVRDLEITRASLEDVFVEFYREDSTPATGGDGSGSAASGAESAGDEGAATRGGAK